MADFTKTAINQNAKREYISPIPSIDAFNEVVNAFKNDTSMGFSKKELTATTFKTKIVYFNSAGDEKAYVNVYAGDKTSFDDGTSLLKGTEASETFAGVGGSGSVEDKEDNWTAKFSCVNKVTINGKEIDDTFTVTIGKDYMTVSSFSYDETIEKIETWADSQTNLA